MQVMCSKECHDGWYDFRCRRGNRLSEFTCPKCGAPMKRRGSLGKRIVCAVCGKRRMSGGQFAKTLKCGCRLKGWDAAYYASVGRIADGKIFPAGTIMCWCHAVEAADIATQAGLDQTAAMLRD